MRESKLIIVSGPAGSGKNTVCERLMQKYPQLERVITATSRPPRGAEKHGQDYIFLSSAEFENLIAEDAFYEYAKVHDKYYGTLKSSVEDGFKRGKDLILIIDVQGAKTWMDVAKKEPSVKRRLLTVFITPASVDQLRKRLVGRGTETQEQIMRRMQTATAELKEQNAFDRVIDSKSKDEDFAALEHIYIEFCEK